MRSRFFVPAAFSCAEPVSTWAEIALCSRGFGGTHEQRDFMSQAWNDPRIAKGMPVQLAARAKRIAAGERPLGWKVGFGAPAALAKFGLGGPLVGYLMEA